ncbi:ATPase component of general energizing module of ECF transporters [Liquorilactobacillus sucicola DSM 21376 = JCM 15457]|uniref:ABC transporter, ATP-binding protein n=1 Tax=Liquorilactobacillus sucicola DSM 21376 = JCM 15457 TaxID=1423806 RepID=A0A023CXA4_9LACO|nr:energy-coupling factor transporter ATPase [Liquorilactobacillus sucicola]KRN06247.1 ABC transporter, ATP-binding protein [Liquorilactobacillus sucicola DSM 21376 = JCM 15457]GAJ26181.1 ATPase component of general energizing module of ECF transporters [Liquorilactobacillus sucicola DSM 21376 = JCM 15457]
MRSIIQTEKLGFHYPRQERLIFENLNISIKEGEMVGILGSNGSGKSTLLKHFNALIRPKKGAVLIDEKWNTKDPETWLDIRQLVGLVFQNPENQIVSTIVEEDIAFALENLGLPREEIKKRVNEVLKIVNMYEYRKRPPYQLSGGQKQRIGIASILAMRPKGIIFDEATSMLDPKGRKDILKIIHELNQKYGVTVLMTTHLLDEVASVDRIIVLNKGRIRFDDKPEIVFENREELEAMGLSIPTVTKLALDLKAEGYLTDSKKLILTKEEFVQAIQKDIGVRA